MLPFISRLRRKWRVELNSVTHWTKNELQPLVAPPSRIRLAVWTGLTELQIRRKVLVLKEKQPTANQCDWLFFFQVLAWRWLETRGWFDSVSTRVVCMTSRQGLDADAPEQAGGAVADDVVAGGVQADDPVGLVAAPGRRVQRVVVGQRPEAAESRADRLASQRVEPEPPRRFARAAGQFNDVAEDQLALTAGIGGGDQLIGGAEQATDDRQLLADPLLVEGLEPEPLGHERQGLQRPLLQGRVVVLWLLEGDQVAQGPGDLVAPALVVTVVPLRGAEAGRQLTGDRRLLGEHDPHATLASAISPTPLQHRSASGAWERTRDSGQATTIHPGRKLRVPAKPIGPYLYYSAHKLRAREERRERLRAELPWKACPGKSPRKPSWPPGPSYPRR